MGKPPFLLGIIVEEKMLLDFDGTRGIAPAGATKGHENKRSLRSPFGNLRRRHSLSFVFLGLCRKYIPERPIRTAGSLDKHADTA
jgi:hypothetical protein